MVADIRASGHSDECWNSVESAIRDDTDAAARQDTLRKMRCAKGESSPDTPDVIMVQTRASCVLQGHRGVHRTAECAGMQRLQDFANSQHVQAG